MGSLAKMMGYQNLLQVEAGPSKSCLLALAYLQPHLSPVLYWKAQQDQFLALDLLLTSNGGVHMLNIL